MKDMRKEDWTERTWAAMKSQQKPQLTKSQDDGAEWPLLKQKGLSLCISVAALRETV